ncbi:MAG: hypothetical protein V2A58_04975 [Planctomycetota bacterium]
MRLKQGEWSFEVKGDRLMVSREGREAVSLGVAPVVEGKATALEGWEEKGAGHFSARVSGRSGDSVHLAEKLGRVAFWMETETDEFANLSYFTDVVIHGPGWHSFSSDEWDRFWEIDLDAQVGVSSCYGAMAVDGGDGQGMTDPGDLPPTWINNIQPRVFALRSEAGWVGLSLPGALPVGVTRARMEGRRWSLSFEALRPACREGGMPVVYFAPGIENPYDVVDVQRELSDALGLTVRKSADQPAWWASPHYKLWDEMARLQRFATFTYDEEGKPHTVLTTENVRKWLARVREHTGIRELNLFFDQTYFYQYGDKRVTDELGGVAGFRALIDELRAEGTRVALYLHLYHVSEGIDFYREHPEAFVKHKTRRDYHFQHGVQVGKSGLQHIDWTHPLGREFMRSWVEFILSDKPGCLNADWLALNNNIGVDPRQFRFHDPDWGIGDLMQKKATELVYRWAKEIKPDCMVRRQSPIDAYMQPFCDRANLCEHWNGWTDDWYRRGRIATRMLRDVIFETDAWFVTITKGYEYYHGMTAWNAPETESVDHTIHPYLSYRELREKDQRRRRSGMQAYMNAPFNRTDLCRCEWDAATKEAEQWRKRTCGKLAGFYAALALSKRCLVTYSETKAVIASSESRFAKVPLPRGAKVERVEQLLHDGSTRPLGWTPVETADGAGAEVRVADAATEVMHTVIRYRF